MDLYGLKYQYIINNGSEDTDITELVMSEPSIIDCVDYRENLSYINEISLNLNNEAGTLYNGSNGLLDTTDKLELIITIYPDDGSIIGKKAFGGYLDLSKIKPDAVKKIVSINAYAYLGEMDRISSLKVSRRYYKGGNLYLYNLKAVLKNADLAGHELEEGKHTISTKLDEDGIHKLAKLDDGEWTSLPASTDVTLYDRPLEQAVKIRDYENLFTVGEQDVIVKVKGDQYPYVCFYDAGLFEVIKCCLVESGFTDYEIQPYEIKTYDDRKIISKYENIEFSTYQGLISDGDDTVYIMLGDSVWKRNIITQDWEKIFTESNNYDITRLEIFGTTLFVYVSPSNFFYRLYKINLLTNASVKLYDVYNNPIVENSNVRNALPFSTKLNKFIFKATGAAYSNPRICTMDLSGHITDVVSISDLVYEGFNFIWEDDDFLYYYFLTARNNPRLNRISYNFETQTFGDKEDLGFWYAWQGVTNLHVYGFYYALRHQLFFRAESNGNESYIYNLETNDFLPDTTINPDGYVLYTPFLRDGILSVIAKKTSPAELRLAHFSHDLLMLDEDFSDSGITFSDYQNDFQKITTNKNYKDFDIITFVNEADKSLNRFSEWFIPYLKGELNPTDGTIRQILDECVRTFLGYFYIDQTRKAFFFKREEYSGGSTVVFNLSNKSRVMENMYSEKYDKIAARNADSYAEYGLTSIESKTLSIDLNYIDTQVLKDIAKYFHDYYSVARKMYTIVMPPAFYTAKTLDTAGLSVYGIDDGIIHEIAPKKGECKFKIIVTQ